MNKFLNYIRNSVGLQSLIVWLIVFIIQSVQTSWMGIKMSSILTFVTVGSMMIIYYVTHEVLLPKLFMKRKKTLYVICSIIMILPLTYFCARLDMYIFTHVDIVLKHEPKFVFMVSRSFTLFLLTYIISSIIFFSKKTTEDAKQKEELLSEKKMLEVRVLKSQINSHFLFNALNNIYSMTYFKDEYTSGYVLKLAQMMRYVMEDCETELTPLYKDIEYIENFIDFQRLRFENDKDIRFEYTGDVENIFVPPMIFQPLVENCFKHAPLEVDRNSYIRILLEVREQQIHFVTENTLPLLKKESTPKENKIGVENVNRRLYLYYGDNYRFDSVSCGDCFKVELVINL